MKKLSTVLFTIITLTFLASTNASAATYTLEPIPNSYFFKNAIKEASFSYAKDDINRTIEEIKYQLLDINKETLAQRPSYIRLSIKRIQSKTLI